MARVPDRAAEGIVACDFVHIDLAGLRRVYALVFLEHSTRRLHITGVTAHHTGSWTVQQARNLAVELGIRVDSLRFLLRDRDAQHPDSFDAAFAADGIKAVWTAPRAPRMNAHGERVVETLRREVLDHLLIRNETPARRVLDACARHDNRRRPYRARGQFFAPRAGAPGTQGRPDRAPSPPPPGTRRRHQRVPVRRLISGDEFPNGTGVGGVHVQC
ncbi:integrase core domain-containing protein [Streptomyces hirsutus]|uniref:integrase core domain-containing protein n=1 Tax=Streptomyces hirsutus TaxID=35620 RepID=UPI00333091D6